MPPPGPVGKEHPQRFSLRNRCVAVPDTLSSTTTAPFGRFPNLSPRNTEPGTPQLPACPTPYGPHQRGLCSGTSVTILHKQQCIYPHTKANSTLEVAGSVETSWSRPQTPIFVTLFRTLDTDLSPGPQIDPDTLPSEHHSSQQTRAAVSQAPAETVGVRPRPCPAGSGSAGFRNPSRTLRPAARCHRASTGAVLPPWASTGTRIPA